MRMVVPGGEYLLALSSRMYSTSATAAGSTASEGRFLSSDTCARCRRITVPARVSASRTIGSSSVRGSVDCCDGSGRSATDNPSMKRFSRSDSSSITCSRSRRPSLEIAAAVIDLAGADQRGDRRLDRRQRRPQIVGQRVEERRLQLLVASRRLRLARAFECGAELLIELLDLFPALFGFELDAARRARRARRRRSR